MVDSKLRPPRTRKYNDRKVIELEYYYFCEDFINSRHLSTNEFFSYMNKKYGSLTRINYKINYYKENISLYYAHKMEVILSYKLACKDNDIRKMISLREEFDSIKNVKINNPIGKSHKLGEIKISNNIRKTKYNEDRLQKVNMAIKRYLKGASDEEVRKILQTKEPIYYHINSSISYISNIEDYIQFIIKYNKINKISSVEINQILEVIQFFIINLRKNFETFVSYKDALEENEPLIRNFHISNEENLKISESLKKLYIWKLNRLKTMLDKYILLYNSIMGIKMFIEGDKTEIQKLLQGVSLKYVDEEFLFEYYSNLKVVLNLYRKIDRNININDDLKDKIKKLYLNNIYEN